MSKFWVVAMETYKRNVKSMSFLVMLFLPVILTLIIGFSGFIGAKFATTGDIAVIAENEEIRTEFLNKSTADVNKKIKDEKTATKALENKDISAYLVISQEDNLVKGEFISDTEMNLTDRVEIQQILTTIQSVQVAESMKLSETDIAQLNASAELKDKVVEFEDGKMNDKEDNTFILKMVAFVVMLIMFVIIAQYSQVTSQEVASEKGTRIMEVILSSTTAATHFYGKIMGIFLVIFTQVFVYAIVGIGSFSGMKNMDIVQNAMEFLPKGNFFTGLIVYNLLYLVLGVLIYTILSAFCASLVSKSEDAAKATMPVTYVLMIGYMVSIIFGMSDPQNIVLRVFSYIPFFSPVTMPIRIGNGTVSTSGILVSLGLLLVGILILLRVSAAIYRSTVLVYNDKGLWQALKQSVSIIKSERKKA